MDVRRCPSFVKLTPEPATRGDNGVRDNHFADVCSRHRPHRDLDGDAPNVTVNQFVFAGVDSGPDVEPGCAHPVASASAHC